MAIRVCPLCQAEFLEYKTTCTHCGVALLDPDAEVDPRYLAEDEQVVYDLSAWPLDARSDAAELLAESGIPHAWMGTEVLLPLMHEDSADQLFEQIEAQHGIASDDGEDDDAESEDAVEAEGDAAESATSAGDVRGETEYDLAGWTTHRRMELVEELVAAGVPHRWEGELLVVSTSLEDKVDDLLDEFDDGVGDDSDLDEADETDDMLDPAEVLSGLFLAAERLRKGKVDVDTYGGLLTSLESAEPERAPYGIDGRLWATAVELADSLADAVAEEADEVEALGTQLHDLLRPYV